MEREQRVQMLRQGQSPEMAETVPHGPLIPQHMPAAVAAETLQTLRRQLVVAVVVETAPQELLAILPQEL